MKKALLICLLVSLALVLFAGSAFALHTQDIQGSRCFRCHSAHQGVGPLLLSDSTGDAAWLERYETVTPSVNCLGCHDGTSGRTVTSMTTGTGSTHQRNYPMQSGVFDVNGFLSGSMPANTSAHAVDIAEAYYTPVSEAPGNENLPHFDAPNNYGRLSCASCHNPHGTNGSHKYLHFNPNDSIDGKFYGGGNWDINSKPEVASVTLTRQADGTYANNASAPWLRSYVNARGGNPSSHYIKYPVAVNIGGEWVFNRPSNSLSTVNFTVNAIDGVIRFDGEVTVPVSETLEARVFLPIRVRQAGTFTGEYYAQDGTPQTTSVRYFEGGNYGNDMSRWCAACHGNYDISNRTGQPFEVDGNTFHGHNVRRAWDRDYATPYTEMANGSEQMNCLSCHFAHGTNAELMWDSNKQVVGSNALRDDTSPANKRYFGGSVCVRCHYNSHGYLFIWDHQMRPEEHRWQ